MSWGLALSGGGLRGSAYIGLFRALEEEGLRPDYISGTSAGSMASAMYVCGYKSKEMAEIAIHLSKRYIAPNIKGILGGFGSLLTGKEPKIDGLIKLDKIEEDFNRITKGIPMKQVKMPVAITAVDINDGTTLYFVSNRRGLQNSRYNEYTDQGTLAQAVRASIAIPVTFQPFMWQGRRLVDGGVTDPMPTEVLKRMGAERIIGVNLGYTGTPKREIDNIFEIGMQSIDIMGYRINQLRANSARLVLVPDVGHIGLFDVEKIPEGIEAGYRNAREHMSEIRRVALGDNESRIDVKSAAKGRM